MSKNSNFDIPISRSLDLLTEVARRCGYADASTFTSKFKKRFSVPPSEFRKRLNSVPIS